jgi:hypothetical protein
VDEDRKSGPDRGGDSLSQPDAAGEPSREGPATLPRSLRRRLDRCADEFLEECGSSAPRTLAPVRSRWSMAQLVIPWSLSFVLFCVAVAGWWPRLFEPEAHAVASSVSQWQAARARDRMLDDMPRVGHWAWEGGGAHGTGDVVWDNERQHGFLRLQGFAPNDPNAARYQLWIFDAGRDDRYPVDGGVFDVPAGRDVVVIPVKPALRVSRPAAFAVTVERPDGAVVSNREQVVAIAHTDL